MYLKGKIHLISTRCMYRYILGTVFKIRSNVWHWQAYWCLKSVTEPMNEWTKANGGRHSNFPRPCEEVVRWNFTILDRVKISFSFYFTRYRKEDYSRIIVRHSSNITKVYFTFYRRDKIFVEEWLTRLTRQEVHPEATVIYFSVWKWSFVTHVDPKRIQHSEIDL